MNEYGKFKNRVWVWAEREATFDDDIDKKYLDDIDFDIDEIRKSHGIDVIIDGKAFDNKALIKLKLKYKPF